MKTINWSQKKIIHLDDHRIVLDGVLKGVRQINKKIRIDGYTDSDKAFHLVVTHIIQNKKIDLFISDFVHSGLDGHEMCNAIRAIERHLKRKPIPILLLTLLGNKHTVIQEGLRNGIFNRYVSLSSGKDEILKNIEELVEN